jgi:drug/metabolite transporter (DMT)-like permease
MSEGNEKREDTTVEENEKEDVVIELSGEETSKSSESLKTIFWLCIACVSSVSMTILNKKIIVDFKYPFVLMAIQNLGSFIVTMIFQLFNRSILPLKPVTMKQFYSLIIPTIGYIGLLWSSFEGLARVSVPLVIVSRNSAPLGTALIETLFMGLTLSFEEYFSLCLILIGKTKKNSSP